MYYQQLFARSTCVFIYVHYYLYHNNILLQQELHLGTVDQIQRIEGRGATNYLGGGGEKEQNIGSIYRFKGTNKNKIITNIRETFVKYVYLIFEQKHYQGGGGG